MKCSNCDNTTEFYGESVLIYEVELDEDDDDVGIDYIEELVCERSAEDTSDFEWKIKCGDCKTELKA